MLFRVLLREPLLEPFDRVVAGEEFRVADNALVERDGGLRALDDELLEGKRVMRGD
jgi:hypothetical protein